MAALRAMRGGWARFGSWGGGGLRGRGALEAHKAGHPTCGEVRRLQEGFGVIPSLGVEMEGAVNEIHQKPDAGREVGDVQFCEIDSEEKKLKSSEGEVPGVDALRGNTQGGQSKAEVVDSVKIFFRVSHIPVFGSPGGFEGFRGSHADRKILGTRIGECSPQKAVQMTG